MNFYENEADLESNHPFRANSEPLRRTNSYPPRRVNNDSPRRLDSGPPRRANSDPSPRRFNFLPNASPNLFSKLVTFFCCLGVSSPSGGDGVLTASPTHSANMFSTLGSFLRGGAPLLNDVGTPLLGGGGVPPAGAVLVDAGMEVWEDFMKEANTFIQWMLSTVFLFIPAKLIVSFAKLLVALWSQEPAPFPVIMDLISQVEKSYFPSIFLPMILLYTGFYLGAKTFKKKNLKFYFEVMSLIIGLGATLVLLVYLDEEGWIYTFGALMVFFLVLCVFKLWDY